MVPLSDVRDVETLRQIGQILERENQRLITKNLELRAELARLRGESVSEQLAFTLEAHLAATRAALTDAAETPAPSTSRAAGTAPVRSRPCPSSRSRTPCRRISARVPRVAGRWFEMVGQVETADRITSVKLTYQIERHARQKYRCACNGAVGTTNNSWLIVMSKSSDISRPFLVHIPASPQHPHPARGESRAAMSRTSICTRTCTGSSAST